MKAKTSKAMAGLKIAVNQPRTRYGGSHECVGIGEKMRGDKTTDYTSKRS